MAAFERLSIVPRRRGRVRMCNTGVVSRVMVMVVMLCMMMFACPFYVIAHRHTSTSTVDTTAEHEALAEFLTHLEEQTGVDMLTDMREAVEEMEEADMDDENELSELSDSFLDSTADMGPFGSLLEVSSDMRSEAHAELEERQGHALTHNAPILPAVHSPPSGKLKFKPSMPARLKFKRMLQAAEDKLRADRSSHGVKTSQHSRKQAKADPAHRSHKHRALVNIASKARAASRSGSRTRAKSGDGNSDGSENGDWATAPVWWHDPGSENVKPWMEDNYGYLLKHYADPNSNMSPDPYPNLAAGRFGTPMHMHRFALHRVLNTPVVKGTPPDVYSYQYPGSPPLPELDATMQPANNLPNPQFYEHDYNKDYIWG